MQAMHAQLMNTLAMHSIIKLWAWHVQRIDERGDRMRGAIIKSIFFLCIANFSLSTLTIVGSVWFRQTIDRSMKSHGTQINIIAPTRHKRKRHLQLHTHTHTHKLTAVAPTRMEFQLKKLKLERQSRCTLRTRRVRRKSSAKIDQSSNQSNRFNLRGKCKGFFLFFFIIYSLYVPPCVELCLVAERRVASRRFPFRIVGRKSMGIEIGQN